MNCRLFRMANLAQMVNAIATPSSPAPTPRPCSPSVSGLAAPPRRSGPWTGAGRCAVNGPVNQPGAARRGRAFGPFLS